MGTGLPLALRRLSVWAAQSAWQQPAAVLINVALLSILASQLATLTWRVFPAPAEPATAAAPSRVPATAGRHEGALRRDVAQWHLFGEVIAERPVALPVEQIPETQLNLTLRGVVAATDAMLGGAIIAAPGGDEAFYRIGSPLPGGATLKEIHADRVILMRGGRFETLRLPQDSLGAGRVPPGEPPNPSVAPPYPPVGTAGFSEYRELIMNNPERLTDLIQIQPFRQGGQFRGYRIQPGRDRALFLRFGLRPGDVVTSVNGVALDDESPATGISVLRSLAEASEARLELERNGVRQAIVVNLQ